MQYYIGWDVGAWHCDKPSRPQDALCVLKDGESGPELVGTAWRGNLKSKLNESRGQSLVRDILSCCELDTSQRFESVIAIDTPLGWPSSLTTLLAGGDIVEIREFRQNPYLFRKTERFLANRGFKPLSAVQDMIGSASTKGIHFLRAIDSQSHDVGVWKANESEQTITVIETYPAPCKSSKVLGELFDSIEKSELFREQVEGKREDVPDALRCALVAWLYAKKPDSLAAPHQDTHLEEGWIWVPKDAFCQAN